MVLFTYQCNFLYTKDTEQRTMLCEPYKKLNRNFHSYLVMLCQAIEEMFICTMVRYTRIAISRLHVIIILGFRLTNI